MSAASMRRRQIAALVALETRRRFLSRRMIPLIVLCAVPLVLFGVRGAVALLQGVQETLAYDRAVFAVMYRTLLLRFVTFFACVAVFGSLIRGEILDRSLHTTLLAPMRRGDLAIGKYLSGLVAVVAVLLPTVAASWAGLHLAHGTEALADAFLTGQALGELGRYLVATALACAGYGALFLVVGIAFRAPMIPALAVLGWEASNFLLPAALKKLSVVHYVESLVPLALPDPSIAVLASPSSPWVAIPGVLAISAGLVWIAARRLRRVEVLYGAE